MPSGYTTDEEIRFKVVEACAAAGGQASFARSHGLLPQVVCEVVNGHRSVPASLAIALGYSRQTVYIKVNRPI
jgi:DNA-binding transcriptional regulator YdaS (Cro superfamily)